MTTALHANVRWYIHGLSRQVDCNANIQRSKQISVKGLAGEVTSGKDAERNITKVDRGYALTEGEDIEI